MLTRQLNSPDLDGFIGETALFLGLEVHHPPFDIVDAIGSTVELRVSSQRGHQWCDACAGESEYIVGGEGDEVCDASEVEVEEGPSRPAFLGEEEGAAAAQQPSQSHCSFLI